MGNAKQINILLVEDNPGDVRLVQEALRDAQVINQLHVARDGVEAMDYLSQSSKPRQAAARPSLILLDLNLPKKSGQELLTEIKNDPELQSIPVVIMTSSNEETDIAKAYKLQANCYITKPLDFTQLLEVMQSVGHFWLKVVQLPRGAL